MDDMAALTPLQLRAKARKLHNKHKLGLIVVDYLQLMHATGLDGRVQEISHISRNLKQLAKELKLPVIVMSQLNRNAEAREGNKPRMSDLRESGAIEQDADVVMLLYREDYYADKTKEGWQPTHIAEINVAKNRNGPTGTKRLWFNDRYTRFEDLESE
jgi:replicative DNA helicase